MKMNKRKKNKQNNSTSLGPKLPHAAHPPCSRAAQPSTKAPTRGPCWSYACSLSSFGSLSCGTNVSSVFLMPMAWGSWQQIHRSFGRTSESVDPSQLGVYRPQFFPSSLLRSIETMCRPRAPCRRGVSWRAEGGRGRLANHHGWNRAFEAGILACPLWWCFHPSNRREKPWSCGNCSPYLKLAAEPHGCVTGLLHKSSAGENPSMCFALPLCLGSTRSFEALALGAAWGVGQPWRHRADRAPAQLGRGGWKTGQWPSISRWVASIRGRITFRWIEPWSLDVHLRAPVASGHGQLVTDLDLTAACIPARL
jgi:hypothetical protein